MNTDVATVAVNMTPIFVGLIAIAGAYWNGTRLERKKAEVALLNEQLGKLYGPLYALSEASRATWKRFREKFRPSGAYFDPENPPSDHELVTWRRWMLSVFMPMNESMVTTIVNNLHLIEGEQIPPSFLDLIAHVEAYKVVKKRWKEGDFSEHTSLLNYPAELTQEVSETFHELKKRQVKLIGRSTT